MKHFIWLDDERNPPKCDTDTALHIARSFNEAVDIIQTQVHQSLDAIYISFDHDLGLGKTGYDFAKWLLEHSYIGSFDVHSMNPVGATNIYELLTHYGWDYHPKYYFFS